MDDLPKDRVWIAFVVMYAATALAAVMTVFLLIKGP
jgi:hypothetical protein